MTLSLYFSLKSPSVEPPIHYFEDNFVEVDSNLQELNADLQLFALTIDTDEYEVSIRKTYDSVSGDDLFFTLEFSANQGLSKKFRLEIVVNKFYKHEELTYTDDLSKTQFSGYTLKYLESSQPMTGTPFVSVDSMGELQIGEQWIYIVRYEETAFGQSTFIETLQSLISIK